MQIIFHEKTKTFHLYNHEISYIMTVLPGGQLGQLYFGKAVRDREDFSHLAEYSFRNMASYLSEDQDTVSLEHLKQEYPVYGTTDYREPAVEVIQTNGSRLSDLSYAGFLIIQGKPQLPGLPAVYVEKEDEAATLIITLKDSVTGLSVQLFYTIFEERPVITRSVCFTNQGCEALHLGRAMSLSMDFPDCDYEWLQFSGVWARERHLKTRNLEPGIVSVGSMRGSSSHEHNPFIILNFLRY